MQKTCFSLLFKLQISFSFLFISIFSGRKAQPKPQLQPQLLEIFHVNFCNVTIINVSVILDEFLGKILCLIPSKSIMR